MHTQNITLTLLLTLLTLTTSAPLPAPAPQVDVAALKSNLANLTSASKLNAIVHDADDLLGGTTKEDATKETNTLLQDAVSGSGADDMLVRGGIGAGVDSQDLDLTDVHDGADLLTKLGLHPNQVNGVADRLGLSEGFSAGLTS
jgi:hypothetical protein